MHINQLQELDNPSNLRLTVAEYLAGCRGPKRCLFMGAKIPGGAPEYRATAVTSCPCTFRSSPLEGAAVLDNAAGDVHGEILGPVVGCWWSHRETVRMMKELPDA